MLDQLRQGAQGWVSKTLMGLLVLSFAIWGIGGFEGYGAGTLASVGDAEVSVQEFARVYEQAQRNSRQAGQQVNPEQVLRAVMMNAALDDAASQYGLGVSRGPRRLGDRQEPGVPERRRQLRPRPLHRAARERRHQSRRLRA